MMRRKGIVAAVFSSVTKAISTVIALVILALCVIGALTLRNTVHPEVKDGHRREIDNTVIERALSEMGDIITATYTYSGIKEITDSRQFFGKDIPLTEHSITLLYDGIIKAGYKVSEISAKVNERAKTIVVELPDPQITDNYINMDTLMTKEKNNILNRIKTGEMTEGLDEIIRSEGDQAVRDGLFRMAEESAKTQITNLLRDLDYTIEFL